jgi:hypothetical protein
VSTPALWLLVAHLSTAGVQASVVADTGRPPVRPRDSRSIVADDQIAFDASRFDSLTASTLRSIFEEARANGLPTRPLVNRALEGAARRTTSDRILRVVREHAAALAQARGALGPRSSEDELEAGAIALRAGLDVRTLEAVRGTRAPGSAVVPLVVLTDIVRRGVPVTNAREAVTGLADAPRADDMLLGLQAAVAKNAPRGPGMALDALNRYLRGTVPSQSPSTPAAIDRKPVRPPHP